MVTAVGSGCARNLQQKLMLLRLQPRLQRRALTELKETAQFITKIS
jgi:hypothetical protein